MSEKKLPAIVKALADDYMELSLINFSMEYFNFHEIFYAEDCWYFENDNNVECVKAIVEAVRNVYTGEMEDEVVLDRLNKYRKEIIERMEVLTAYTDRFQLSEYLLNRVEKKFEKDLPDYDDDEEAKKILQFIFEPEDNMEVNLRIKEMLSQIPVRMTTTRFLDLVKDSVSVYKGAERESLNGFIYMIESAAGIYNPEKINYHRDMEEFKEALDKIDYKNIDYDKYRELICLMDDIEIYVDSRTDYCMICQKMLNNLQTYYTLKKYSSGTPAIAASLKELSDMINNSFERSVTVEDYQEMNILREVPIEDYFSPLEGRPEKLVTSISVSEGKLESIKDELNAVDSCVYLDFQNVSKLMSSSEFVDLDAVIDVTECTPEIIEEASIRLIEKLAKELDGKDKVMKRAIMASVLKELPVFFISHTEVMNYVRYSLEHCKDKAEKAAAVQMFWQVYE